MGKFSASSPLALLTVVFAVLAFKSFLDDQQLTCHLAKDRQPTICLQLIEFSLLLEEDLLRLEPTPGMNLRFIPASISVTLNPCSDSAARTCLTDGTPKSDLNIALAEQQFSRVLSTALITFLPSRTRLNVLPSEKTSPVALYAACQGQST